MNQLTWDIEPKYIGGRAFMLGFVDGLEKTIHYKIYWEKNEETLKENNSSKNLPHDFTAMYIKKNMGSYVGSCNNLPDAIKACEEHNRNIDRNSLLKKML